MKEITDQTSAPNPWAEGFTGRGQQDIMAWRPPVRQADDDHRADHKANMGRAREVGWQEPYGANALMIKRDSIIGKHYKLSLKIDADGLGISEEKAHEWEQQAEREWQRYAEGSWFGADASRKNTFTFMMHQVLSGLHTDGEVFGVVTLKEGWEGYTTALHLIEPERIEDPPDTVMPEGIEIRNGVEIDRMGEPIAYYIRHNYPAGRNGSYQGIFGNDRSDQHERVLRQTEWGRPVVLHLYDEHRPSMTRGISSMVSVLKQMKMLGHYSDTELERAIMAASFAAVIESDLDYEQAMGLIGAEGGSAWGNNNLTAAAMAHLKAIAPYHQQVGLRFNGSRVAHLLPGEKLNVVQSAVNGAEYDKFEKAIIRQIAAGSGVAAESLSRDFSDTSYSAARMSLADIWRSFMVRRELINKRFAMPFVAAWMEEAILSEFLPMPDGSAPTLDNWLGRRPLMVRGGFISWGKPIIDPTKEYQGKQMAMSLGVSTLEEEAASEGKDWDDVLRQRAKEKDRREELGLNQFDFDPSLAFAGGGPQQSPEAKGGDAPGGGTAE